MATPNNPNVEYTSEGRLGVAFNRRTNPSTEVQPIEHKLGTTVIDTTGKVWVYVHAQNAIGSNVPVTILWNSANSVDCLTCPQKTVNFYFNGTASFSQNDYGWVQGVHRLGTFPPAGYTGSGP